VDDEKMIREMLAEVLASWEYEASTAGSAEEALEALARNLVDVVLLDIMMPGMSGIDLLREIKHRDLDVDVLMMTGRPTVETAVQALKAGACDYLEKPLNLDVLRHLMGGVIERRLLRQEVHALRARVGDQLGAMELVGVSAAMQRLRDLIDRVAGSDSPVLIEGESGTGKELVAGAIHHRSPRSRAPFIPVNCGAIPADLMESEFFGHARGAFSGAVADALGLIRSAHGGTIFLDEIAELPAALQVKLLRVLQDMEVRPVGSVKAFKVDVRVIAATNQNVEQAVRAGTFRQDLFYRLNVVSILVPPLRERRADIPPLVTHFLRQLNQKLGRRVSGVGPDAMAALMGYDFPGNVRELENLLHRAYALGAREQITLEDLPVLQSRPEEPAPAGGLPTLAAAERELILRVLRHHSGDKDQAARALGISRRTLYRRIEEYGA
jgi:DNA-binding NtrC family response regulator